MKNRHGKNGTQDFTLDLTCLVCTKFAINLSKQAGFVKEAILNRV